MAERLGKSKSLLPIGCVEDHIDIVEFLLVDCKSKATIKTDLKSLTAHELHADWFDWKNDFKEIESNQNSKAKERKSKLKGKLRERDWERNAERLRTSVGGGKSVNRLDGGNFRKVENWAEGSGLSGEQRTRLDRERERFVDPAMPQQQIPVMGKKGTMGVFDNQGRENEHLADYKESGMPQLCGEQKILTGSATGLNTAKRPMSCQSLDQVVQGVEPGIGIIKVDDEGDLELDERIRYNEASANVGKFRHTHKGYDYDQRW
ncbi:hypothetical protein PPACK8108_LOCUS10614 [Phakopsora pachyrhizi]|uniref:Uncharacterized protein n=1 Tax=Phakopsora pachyrhizi TaxID=170000 RepID=A0AAV0B1L8_PHAPC|nr:hypothetical protein PPACK8108_LOCUS10614 [Phakopsora pachyrhizi]